MFVMVMATSVALLSSPTGGDYVITVAFELQSRSLAELYYGSVPTRLNREESVAYPVVSRYTLPVIHQRPVEYPLSAGSGSTGYRVNVALLGTRVHCRAPPR